MSLDGLVENFSVVIAQNQTKGRGQLGSKWIADKDKNLTFSMYYEATELKFEEQFFLNCVVSLSIHHVLKRLILPQLKIKWPNDILSENKKICGILIENVIKQQKVWYSVIGIGINVNQLQFSNEFKASSLQLLTGRSYDIEYLMLEIVKEFKMQVLRLKFTKELILKDYQEVLFRKNKPSTFKNIEGELFSGFIKGVTSNGKLQVLLEDEVLKSFNLKEIKLLY